MSTTKLTDSVGEIKRTEMVGWREGERKNNNNRNGNESGGGRERM